MLFWRLFVNPADKFLTVKPCCICNDLVLDGDCEFWGFSVAFGSLQTPKFVYSQGNRNVLTLTSAFFAQTGS